MKKSLIYGILFLTILWVAGCKKHNHDDMGPKTDQVILQNNQNQLKSRLDYKNSGLISINENTQATSNTVGKKPINLGVQGTGDAGDANFSLALVAEVAPPTYNGSLLRATHVAVSGNYAYVTYNTEGDTYLGGIDVIDISDINNPKLVTNATLPNVDLSAVAVDGDRLLLAGAGNIDAIAGLTSPAWAAYLPLQGGLPVTSYQTINITGYVGTDVASNSSSCYAVSGDNGVIARLNKTTGAVETSVSIADLRAVRASDTKVVALSGTQGIKIFDGALSLINTIATPTDVPESKRTLDFYQDYILAAEGANGLGIYNINTGTLFQQVKIAGDNTGIDPSDLVTNAVSANGDNIFVANGGAGIAIYHFNSATELNFLGSASFRAIDQSSSNFVISRDNYVFVASGKGGLKILKMIALTPPAGNCTGNYGPYTGQTQYDYNINSGESYGFADTKEFNSAINISGTLNWCGWLKVDGGYTNINSNGAFNMSGTLIIVQNISVNGNMNMSGMATVGGNLTVNGSGTLNIKGNLAQGNSGSNTTLQIDGKVIIDGEVVCYGNISINGSGSVEFANANSKLIVYGNVTNNGKLINGTITHISS